MYLNRVTVGERRMWLCTILHRRFQSQTLWWGGLAVLLPRGEAPTVLSAKPLSAYRHNVFVPTVVCRALGPLPTTPTDRGHRGLTMARGNQREVARAKTQAKLQNQSKPKVRNFVGG